MVVTLWMVALVAGGPLSETKGPQKIAVSQFTGLGLDEQVVNAFSRYLETSLATIEGVSLISSIDVEIALQSPSASKVRRCGEGTRARTRCAVAIGRLVGADFVIYGTIGALGESFSVNLRAVSVATQREVSKHTATLSGGRDLLIPEVRLAAFKLVAPDRIVGSLKIDVDIAGVVVEIDGRRVGVTPLKNSVTDLTPGPHVIVMRRPGFREVQKEFVIEPFETARFKLELRGLD